MVNIALRGPGRNHAWLEATFHPRPLGSSFDYDRDLHVAHHPGAISHDLIPARLNPLHKGGLVANRRAGSGRVDPRARNFPLSPVAGASDRLSLPAKKESLRMNR